MGGDSWEKYPDTPDLEKYPKEEMARLMESLIKTLELGIGAVYGQEDGVPDLVVDCDSRLQKCKLVCCTVQFALTKDEVQKGIIMHDTKRPFFIARDGDGYCSRLHRDTLRCSVWNDRPLRCRSYDCSDDNRTWPGR